MANHEELLFKSNLLNLTIAIPEELARVTIKMLSPEN